MSPNQFAVLTVWVFYALGAVIHLNVESALKARNIGHAEGTRLLGVAEFIISIWFAITGALIWGWIA